VIGLIEDDCMDEGIFTLRFVCCDVLEFSFSNLFVWSGGRVVICF
jgi:hypothetical protein